LICPKCGEDNSDNFRFCGMCGAVIEARVEPRLPGGAPVPNLPGIEQVPDPFRPWNQPGASPSSSNQPSPNLPSMDALRETAFSGLDSFFEPEQPKHGGRRVFLLVVLLAALGGASWWTYTNYMANGDKPQPEPTVSSSAQLPAEKPAVRDEAPTTNRGAAKSAPVPEAAQHNAPQSADRAQKTLDTEAEAAVEAKPTPQEAPAHQKIAPSKPVPEKREVRATPVRPPSMPAAADTGEAAFRRGEAYLYGRGGAENCDEAVKYLKAASAKSNAKARSAFGTMYATGHCVPRDLPTAYLWFALALHADPNNQILEKDLSAVWNQMTPPERQMATKMKQ
jgi:hypothetical protein